MEIKKSNRKFKVYANVRYNVLGFTKTIKVQIGIIIKLYTGDFGFQSFQGFILSTKELKEIIDYLKELN